MYSLFLAGVASEVRSHAMPSAVLPSSLFTKIKDEDVDLIFGAYESPVLFRNTQLENTPFEVASVILTVSLGRSVNNLIEDVEITMPLLSEVSITIVLLNSKINLSLA